MGEQVRHALETHFHGARIELDELPGGRLTGHIAWNGFADQDHVARQELIRGALREALGSEARQVGILLAYTPDELELMAAA